MRIQRVCIDILPLGSTVISPCKENCFPILQYYHNYIYIETRAVEMGHDLQTRHGFYRLGLLLNGWGRKRVGPEIDQH